MSVRFLQVDAFSATPFGGNPAAVVMMPAGASDDGLMQRIAAENNLAETAFVIPLSADASDAVGRGSRFGLRWFTPKCEVDLCGHATLATAAALFMACHNTSPALTFATRSGDLIARRWADRAGGAPDGVWMDFPANPPVELELGAAFAEYGAMIRIALSGLLDEVGEGAGVESLVARVAHSTATRKLIVLLKQSGSECLAKLGPDTAALQATHDGSSVRGIAITTEGVDASENDFYSRYFAPWNGIPEDAVTGSLHTVLAPFWAATFEARAGADAAPRTALVGRQCSPRGGTLHLRLDAARPVTKATHRIQIGGEFHLFTVTFYANIAHSLTRSP